jgi:hypothetical protein
MLEVEKRLDADSPYYSQNEVMQRLSITQADVDAAQDVEIE